MRAAGAEQQRVAVGRRLRHRRRAQHAAGAPAVLDDHGLPELLAELRRHDARDHVDPPPAANGTTIFRVWLG